MLAIERREYILNRLRKEGRVQVRELSQELGVSHMTIHRDLDYLVSVDDRVKKVFGGAILDRPYQPEPGKCAMCGKPVPSRTGVSLQTASGQRLEACCPHCALLLVESRGDVVSGMATDYILERVVNLKSAVFLLESDVVVCCTPSVLCFEDEDHARRFQQGFGGQIADLEEAKKQVVFHMTLS
ncbi:MAG TPA: DeoR family transcriptional regulator [Anaerolineae bacterium]|nr:DeoR family transcriptional regulator [Anaerolineae bacterium]